MKRLLHATTTRDDFQVLAALEFPISLELEKGIRHLPRSTRIHSTLVQINQQAILEMTTETHKTRLVLLRSAREDHTDRRVFIK